MTPTSALPPFIPFPRFLLTDRRFSGLSNNAKLFYGLLIDRAKVSKKNGWVDDHGRVYLYYSIAEASQALNLSRQTVTNAMKELTDMDLLERKRQGCGKPSIINIKLPCDVQELDIRTTRNRTSRCPKTSCSDSRNLYGSHNKKNYKYISNNHSINHEELRNILNEIKENKGIPIEYAGCIEDITAAVHEITMWDTYSKNGYDHSFDQELYLMIVRCLIEMVTTRKATYNRQTVTCYDVIDKINANLSFGDNWVSIMDPINCFIYSYKNIVSEYDVKAVTPHMKACLWSFLAEYKLQMEAAYSRLCNQEV